MSPRRDVEGEIYEQLYGHPRSGSERPAERVIGDEAGWSEVPWRPEPPERQPLTRLDRALDAAVASLAGLSAGVRVLRLRSASSGGVRFTRYAGFARQPRALAVGAVAAAVLALAAVVGLGAGSGEEAVRHAGGPTPPPAEERAQAVAGDLREARSARRERAARKRRAARRRAAERSEARREATTRASSRPERIRLLCVDGGGCVPAESYAGRRLRSYGDDSSRRSTDGDDDGGDGHGSSSPSVAEDSDTDSGSDDGGDGGDRSANAGGGHGDGGDINVDVGTEASEGG